MTICKQCQRQFEITEDDLQFYDKLSPVFAGKKIQIPSPQFCPECRLQRRFAFRNERKLYHRNCDLTGKKILSIYSPDSPYKVYDRDVWWSDKWDALSYGRDFDFSKTLSEQLKELYTAVPHTALYATNVENSEYTNFVLNQKNCYLIFGAGNNEDCMFGKFVVYCKDAVDCLAVYSCELCYEGIASERCYDCRFFLNCRSCTGCSVIEDCSTCSDCIGCFGLRNKQYCIFNKQYSREEYENLKPEYEFLTSEKITAMKQKLDELKSNLPHVQSHIFSSENCTGESVYNSRNCFNAFDCKDCEDCKYIYFSPKTVYTQDNTFCAPDGNRFCYNLCSTVGLENSMTNFFVWYGSNIYYSMDCHHCNDIFACVGLRNQKYCILNKQYSKEDYEQLVAKIIEHMQKTGEWGDYFPFNISPFAYNETIAQESFPLTQDQAAGLGCSWKNEQENVDDEAGFVPPDDIRQVDDSICNQVLKCEVSGRKYKIIPRELAFYRKMKLPIPRIHPDERHYNRLKFHNSYKLWNAKCAKCGADIQTVYSPSSGVAKNVYCEKCYLGEVY